ncbi:MAG: PDZ domain-containing protein [Planctomycetota bacterium]
MIIRTLLAATLLASPAAICAADVDSKPTPTAPEASAKERPFFGVVVKDIDGGVEVTRVLPGTTAATLGLAVGDQLLTVNGSEVPSRLGLAKLLRDTTVGSEVSATWLHDGAAQAGSATLRGRPGTETTAEPQLREARTRLDQLRDAHATQMEDISELRREEGNLGKSLSELAATLDALPAAMQEAADEFKAVYPDGEFTISINIDIRTNADPALRLKLGQTDGDADSDADSDADADSDTDTAADIDDTP